MDQQELFKSRAIPLSPPPDHSAAAKKDDSPPYSAADTDQAAYTSQCTITPLPEIIETSFKAQLVTNNVFKDMTLRCSFIKKVYSILMSQMMLTGLIIFSLMQIQPSGVLFLREHFLVFYSATTMVYFMMFSYIRRCEGPRRKMPWNYIFLLLFFLFFSIALYSIHTPLFQAEQVLIAAGITFAIVLVVTLYAFQIKIDFTLLTGSGFWLLLSLVMLGIAAFATSSYDPLRLVYLTICVIVVSIFIVWDTQLIVGGNHRYAFSAEEYVIAAMILYIDIMCLFMRILRFLL